MIIIVDLGARGLCIVPPIDFLFRHQLHHRRFGVVITFLDDDVRDRIFPSRPVSHKVSKLEAHVEADLPK